MKTARQPLAHAALAIALIVLAEERSASAQVVTTTNPPGLIIYPKADTTLRAGSFADTNYGQDLWLLAKQLNKPRNIDIDRAIVVQFDITSILSVGPFDKVSLVMTGFNDQAGQFPISVWAVPWALWDETFMTYNAWWGAQSSLYVLLYPPMQTVTVNSTVEQTYQWDITDFIRWELSQGLIQPTFYLYPIVPSTGPITQFFSGETGTNKSPYLSVAKRSTAMKMMPDGSMPDKSMPAPTPPKCDRSQMGNSCAGGVVAQGCTGGPTNSFTGLLECSSNMITCVPRFGIDYCTSDSPSCGGACGNCVGASCTSNSQCVVGSICDFSQGSGNGRGVCNNLNSTTHEFLCPSMKPNYCWAPGNPPSLSQVCQ